MKSNCMHPEAFCVDRRKNQAPIIIFDLSTSPATAARTFKKARHNTTNCLVSLPHQKSKYPINMWTIMNNCRIRALIRYLQASVCCCCCKINYVPQWCL